MLGRLPVAGRKANKYARSQFYVGINTPGQARSQAVYTNLLFCMRNSLLQHAIIVILLMTVL